ncbi:hypothetical protein OH492_20520 [Vibrio chagasii]|nr:hypothetical protein [Vibrio chagasii]
MQSASEFNGIAISEVIAGSRRRYLLMMVQLLTEGNILTAEIIGKCCSDQISGTDLDDVIHAGRRK